MVDPRCDEAQSTQVTAQFVREVRGELRKVAWPTKQEVVKYSTVVFLTVVLLTLFIFGLDYLFGEAVLYLFD